MQRMAKTVSPKYISQSLQTRSIIQKFADTHSLVYFGNVNYRTDEHRLVRGMTTDANQEDSHYCIGTFNAYDVVFVRRASEVRGTRRYWLIMQIDLRTRFDMPHVCIGPHPGKNGQYDDITSVLHSFQPITLGVFGAHDKRFMQNYTLYTKPSRNLDAERLFTPEITKQIADHFPPLGIEIWDGCVFIYAAQRRPNAQLLDAMLRNGVWLAETLDAKAKELADEQALLVRTENE